MQQTNNSFVPCEYLVLLVRLCYSPSESAVINGPEAEAPTLGMMKWYEMIPVVPHKAVAEVSKIGNL